MKVWLGRGVQGCVGGNRSLHWAGSLIRTLAVRKTETELCSCKPGTACIICLFHIRHAQLCLVWAYTCIILENVNLPLIFPTSVDTNYENMLLNSM